MGVCCSVNGPQPPPRAVLPQPATSPPTHEEDDPVDRRRPSGSAVPSTPVQERRARPLGVHPVSTPSLPSLPVAAMIEHTPMGAEAERFRYSCPLCFRHFDRILATSCCRNYICGECADLWWHSRHPGQAPEPAPRSAISLACPNCAFEGGFVLASVDPGATVRRYIDSPATKEALSAAAARSVVTDAGFPPASTAAKRPSPIREEAGAASTTPRSDAPSPVPSAHNPATASQQGSASSSAGSQPAGLPGTAIGSPADVATAAERAGADATRAGADVGQGAAGRTGDVGSAFGSARRHPIELLGPRGRAVDDVASRRATPQASTAGAPPRHETGRRGFVAQPLAGDSSGRPVSADHWQRGRRVSPERAGAVRRRHSGLPAATTAAGAGSADTGGGQGVAAATAGQTSAEQVP